ncbi:MAG: hypothetical protein JWM90_1118 [Thermoleophilia bacterium]|nr:hypothetical protein [Thermoleophilia bacterium]
MRCDTCSIGGRDACHTRAWIDGHCLPTWSFSRATSRTRDMAVHPPFQPAGPAGNGGQTGHVAHTGHAGLVSGSSERRRPVPRRAEGCRPVDRVAQSAHDRAGDRVVFTGRGYRRLLLRHRQIVAAPCELVGTDVHLVRRTEPRASEHPLARLDRRRVEPRVRRDDRHATPAREHRDDLPPGDAADEAHAARQDGARRAVDRPGTSTPIPARLEPALLRVSIRLDDSVPRCMDRNRSRSSDVSRDKEEDGNDECDRDSGHSPASRVRSSDRTGVRNEFAATSSRARHT